MRQARKNWTREQIRAARKTPLNEVLERRGWTLRHTGAGNFVPAKHPGIIVKDCYWRNPDADSAGNTIDFLVDVIGCSFAQAMQEIMQVESTQ